MLAAQLRDAEPLRITFDNDVASKVQVELVSSRHPLVRLALKVLDESALSLSRFAVVSVPGLKVPPAGCVARIDLVESTGMRPRLELWVTAVDPASGASVDVAGPLLDAVAHGRLQDASTRGDGDLSPAMRLLEDRLRQRRKEVEEQRRADNDALLGARVASRISSLDHKLRRARATLREVQDRDRDQRVARLHEGRIRNLEAAREAVQAEAAGGRDLHISTSAIAVVQIQPG